MADGKSTAPMLRLRLGSVPVWPFLSTIILDGEA